MSWMLRSVLRTSDYSRTSCSGHVKGVEVKGARRVYGDKAVYLGSHLYPFKTYACQIVPMLSGTYEY